MASPLSSQMIVEVVDISHQKRYPALIKTIDSDQQRAIVSPLKPFVAKGAAIHYKIAKNEPSECVDTRWCRRHRGGSDFLQSVWLCKKDASKDPANGYVSVEKSIVHGNIMCAMKDLPTRNGDVLILDTMNLNTHKILTKGCLRFDPKNIYVCTYNPDDATELSAPDSKVATFAMPVDILLRSLPISIFQYVLVFLDFNGTINPDPNADGYANSEALKWLFFGEHCADEAIVAITCSLRGSVLTPREIVSFVEECARAGGYQAVLRDDDTYQYILMLFLQFRITRTLPSPSRKRNIESVIILDDDAL